MSLRISDAGAAALLLVLVACSGGGETAAGEGEDTEAVANEVPSASEDDGKLDCALDGAAEFARVCEIERASGEGREILIFRHPDGGFRRFEIVRDGRGIVPADGMENAEVALDDDGRLIVTVEDDSYRLPATVRRGVAAEADQDDGAQP